MKKILVIVFVTFASFSYAQTSSHDRDSVAQMTSFQTKVKMATHKAANAILADPAQATRVRQYAQMVITEPNGAWLTSMSYGVMTNGAINAWSVDSDIEYTVNSLFAKFAYAYYREQQPAS